MMDEAGLESDVLCGLRPNPSQAEKRIEVEGLPESRETYWRWGLPSLVLAVVTVLLGLASWLYMQPRIVGRYEGIVERGLGREVEYREPMVGELGGFRTAGEGRGDAESVESRERWLEWGHGAIEALRGAELAANRLTVQFPMSALPRWQAGQLALRLEATYEAIAEGMERVEDEDKRKEYRQRAFEARGRGVDSFRSATRLEGPGRLEAELWLLEDQVRGFAGRGVGIAAELSRVEERLEGMLRESDAPAGAMRLMGQVQLKRAFGMEFEEGEGDRGSKLESGIQHLVAYLRSLELKGGSVGGEDFVAQVWLAEGEMSVSRAEGVKRAKEAIQGSVSTKSKPGKSIGVSGVLEVDALFRALLLIGSMDEAWVVVASRLGALSSADQELLRATVADSCLRAVSSHLYFPRGGFSDVSPGSLLGMSMRVSPGSEGVVTALHSIVVDSSGADWERWVGPTERIHAADGEKEDGIVRVLRWYRRAYRAARLEDTESKEGESEEKLEVGFGDADLLVAGLPLVFRWLQSNEIEAEAAREIVGQMLVLVPQSNDLKYARAMLSVRLQDYQAASEELRDLLERAPGNTGLQSALRDVEAKMNSAKAGEKPKNSESSDGSPQGQN